MPWSTKVHQPVPVPEEKRARAKSVVSRSRRGYTAQWYEASREYLKRNPLCVVCLIQGMRSPSRVTDHTIPHGGDMVLFWDHDNWQALCKRHHDMKTAYEIRYDVTSMNIGQRIITVKNIMKKLSNERSTYESNT